MEITVDSELKNNQYVSYLIKISRVGEVSFDMPFLKLLSARGNFS